MVHWFNFTDGRRFSFISSTLGVELIDSLVDAGFYYMGEPGQVRCCGCRNKVMISYDTRLTHKLEVPDCFLITFNLVMNNIPMEVKIGISRAEEELKQLLRNHRKTYQLSYRLRTFDAMTDPIFATNGFIRNDDCLECTYCHFVTTDWNPETIETRHKTDRPNCIFNDNFI